MQARRCSSFELRKRRMLQVRIARSVGVSASAVSRVLARAGMSRLSDLEPVDAVVRYEHEAPPAKPRMVLPDHPIEP